MSKEAFMILVSIWKCTLCNLVFVHPGEDPPETCPACGPRVNRDQFHLVSTGEEMGSIG